MKIITDAINKPTTYEYETLIQFFKLEGEEVQINVSLTLRRKEKK